MNKIDRFIREHTLSIQDIANGKKPENIDMSLLREASMEMEAVEAEIKVYKEFEGRARRDFTECDTMLIHICAIRSSIRTHGGARRRRGRA